MTNNQITRTLYSCHKKYSLLNKLETIKGRKTTKRERERERESERERERERDKESEKRGNIIIINFDNIH